MAGISIRQGSLYRVQPASFVRFHALGGSGVRPGGSGSLRSTRAFTCDRDQVEQGRKLAPAFGRRPGRRQKGLPVFGEGVETCLHSLYLHPALPAPLEMDSDLPRFPRVQFAIEQKKQLLLIGVACWLLQRMSHLVQSFSSLPSLLTARRTQSTAAVIEMSRATAIS